MSAETSRIEKKERLGERAYLDEKKEAERERRKRRKAERDAAAMAAQDFTARLLRSLLPVADLAARSEYYWLHDFRINTSCGGGGLRGSPAAGTAAMQSSVPDAYRLGSRPVRARAAAAPPLAARSTRS